MCVLSLPFSLYHLKVSLQSWVSKGFCLNLSVEFYRMPSIRFFLLDSLICYLDCLMFNISSLAKNYGLVMANFALYNTFKMNLLAFSL